MVRKKIFKWLDHAIICPISNSEWLSPVQVVQQNIGIIMIENETLQKIMTLAMEGFVAQALNSHGNDFLP